MSKAVVVRDRTKADAPADNAAPLTRRYSLQSRQSSQANSRFAAYRLARPCACRSFARRRTTGETTRAGRLPAQAGEALCRAAGPSGAPVVGSFGGPADLAGSAGQKLERNRYALV
jgi:hypothetical protein